MWMGTWLVSEKIQKKTKRKQRLSLGLGATKPIDHTQARMVFRLAEIKAEVMCCMSTTADTLNHQDPFFQGHGSQLTANEPHPYWPGFYWLRKGRVRQAYSLNPGSGTGIYRCNNKCFATGRPYFSYIIELNHMLH